MYKIVLLRHGESVWNKENRFTGWTDVDLSPLGIKEVEAAGEILKKEGYVFDLAFTSVLKRAIKTTEVVLGVMGLENIETRFEWRLNERQYGGLQGLNKSEMAKKFGEERVYIWRRSFLVPPPAMTDADFKKQADQEIFRDVPRDKLPRTESMSDAYVRVVDCLRADIVPAIMGGKKILISAHGTSLRSIVKYLDGISDDEIMNLNIPTGMPLVYELGDNLKPIRHYYLGDEKELTEKIKKVENQGKAK